MYFCLGPFEGRRILIPTGHKSFDCFDRHADAGEVSALQNSKALGLGTRPVAFILSGMMAVAYWQFHAPNGMSPVQNQGIPAVLFCFLFLYMAAQGGRDWSLDALIRRKRESAASAR